MQLTYSEISKQLQFRVEKFNASHPDDRSFRHVTDNSVIVNRCGEFVTVLTALIGHANGAEYNRFDELCLQYQASSLKDIPIHDANELWHEFISLLSK